MKIQTLFRVKAFGLMVLVLGVLAGCERDDDEWAPQDPRLQEKIGQMLVLGFRGMELGPDDQIVRDIIEGRIGGVVLFDRDVALGFAPRNIESPQQLQALNGFLTGLPAKHPLLITIDQEGGRVARLKPDYGFPATVSAQYLGGLDVEDSTRFHAGRIAQTLHENLINVNLAPVVDVNINPESPAIGAIERSFSDDPEIVVRHAGFVIEEHHARGLLTTLKHFPGHGSATADSHHGLTDVTHTWQPSELIPYQQLIQAGKADMVMTAHIFNQNWDSQYPATLSHHVITGILRQQLGFQGVIISDDMNMGAITEYYGLAEAILLSIEAGLDILIFANNLVYDEHIALKAHDIILDHIRHGRLSEQRIDESFQRIMQLKSKLKHR